MTSCTHIMLDIETMGVGIHAPIWAIGAVAFDPNNDITRYTDSFYRIIDLPFQEEVGRRFDGSTITFWLDENNRVALNEYVNCRHRISLTNALDYLTDWMDMLPGDRLAIWGNGPSFDNAVILDAYRQTTCLKTARWDRKADRCFRTMKNIPGCEDLEVVFGTPHKAVDDALTQAYWLQRIVAKLGITL